MKDMKKKRIAPMFSRRQGGIVLYTYFYEENESIKLQTLGWSEK